MPEDGENLEEGALWRADASQLQRGIHLPLSLNKAALGRKRTAKQEGEPRAVILRCCLGERLPKMRGSSVHLSDAGACHPQMLADNGFARLGQPDGLRGLEGTAEQLGGLRVGVDLQCMDARAEAGFVNAL